MISSARSKLSASPPSRRFRSNLLSQGTSFFIVWRRFAALVSCHNDFCTKSSRQDTSCPVLSGILLLLICSCQGGGTSGTGIIPPSGSSTPSSDGTSSGTSPVCGTVVSPDGQPQRGIVVSSSQSDEQVLTDDLGGFIISVVPDQLGNTDLSFDENGQQSSITFSDRLTQLSGGPAVFLLDQSQIEITDCSNVLN